VIRHRGGDLRRAATCPYEPPLCCPCPPSSLPPKNRYATALSVLPMELQRQFNLMRELDSQSQLLLASIRERLQALAGPDAAGGGGARGGAASAPPATPALERLRQDCRRALEQADEKVALAAHVHDMVRAHGPKARVPRRPRLTGRAV
jgi:hypothetical protein